MSQTERKLTGSFSIQPWQPFLWAAGLVATTVALATPPAPAQTPAADPCADSLSLSFAAPADFLSTSVQTRVMTLCELRNAIVSEYSLFDLKKERIKAPDGTAFDGIAYLNQCVARERTNTEDNSDLHFLNRVSKCIAGFHDTHFWVAAPVAVPYVMSGIVVTSIGGKYYISQIYSDLLSYVNTQAGGSDTLKNAIQIGNQVLEVDGQDPAALSAHYAQFIPGSSDDFVRIQADSAIFLRNFLYPKRNSVQLKIQDSAGKTYSLALPWWGASGSQNRADAMNYFQSIGIPLTDRVKILLNASSGQLDWRKATLATTGYSDSDPLYHGDPFNRLYTYMDDGGAPGLRAGEVVASAGVSFCYMQLLTFETATFKDSGGASTSFSDTVGAFVADCKAKGLDLVLDLRFNPGGNGDLPDVLLSLLTETGKTYPSPVLAVRITPDIGRVFSSDSFDPGMAFKDFGDFDTSIIDAIKRAAKAGATESDIMPTVARSADSGVGGYPGRIFALVTPKCVSACDMTASLLKKSGRATLIGSHSNGTGAGFESSDSLDSTFKDSNDELAIKIPNFMFGIPDKVLDSSAPVPYGQYKDSYLLENKPTVADVQYSTTFDDLNPSNLGGGWKATIMKAIQAR